MTKIKKGDWVRYSSPLIRFSFQFMKETPLFSPTDYKDAEKRLHGFVVGEEGDQLLVLHAGQDSPVLRDPRDLKRIEVNKRDPFVFDLKGETTFE